MVRVSTGVYTGKLASTGRSYTIEQRESKEWFLFWNDSPQFSISARKKKRLVSYLQDLDSEILARKEAV